jgi:hypothetical protein
VGVGAGVGVGVGPGAGVGVGEVLGFGVGVVTGSVGMPTFSTPEAGALGGSEGAVGESSVIV